MFDAFNKLNPDKDPPIGTEYKVLKQVKMLRFLMDGLQLFSTDMLKTYAATINEIQDVSVTKKDSQTSSNGLDSKKENNNNDDQ